MENEVKNSGKTEVKAKKKTQKSVIVLIVAVVVLALSGVLGLKNGTFAQVEDIASMININGQSIVRLLIAIAFLVAINAIVQLIFQVLTKKTGRIGTLATVFSSLIKYVIVIVGICWGLAILGINTGTIIASVGIVALIVSFGAESMVADIVSGAFILFEDQYNRGDIVELDGFRGTIEYIGIRTTGIRDAGKNLKIVNNSDIKNIINRSESSSVAVTTVGISYATNQEEIEKLIPTILEEIKARDADRAQRHNCDPVFIGEIRYLGVEELADSCVVLKFMADVREKDVFGGKRRLNSELKILLDKHKVEIAYPQVDVHMR